VPGRPGFAREGAPGREGASQQGDQQIAAVLYLGCRNHIEIAQFAQDKLTNEQAKEFAQKMVSDHSPGCEKLKELAGNLVSEQPGGGLERGAPGRPGAAPSRRPGAGAAPGATPPARPGGDRPDASRDEGGGGAQEEADTPAEERRENRAERREERREAVREAAPGGLEVEAPGVNVRTGQAGGLNWGQIHQQIADQCLNTLKKEFNEIEGADFDKAYMAHEVMVHLSTIDSLTVLKNHASPTLKADLDKSLQMAKQHLEEAKQIKQQLKSEEGGTPRLSRTPGKAAPPATTPKAKNE
jgi:predicted outer membrane protein